ncbi:DUF3991 and toprim domain-containing protein [Desulfosporosinus metallidurans]|uniref:DUF3991 domain-containing protein n=1 Tax=Desulfosporosinus metallidurans TaxID=1888891 RepID=A0A1Q8QS76_9FIRM|nr:DUF3991 and toprim domain-containing protein [Desulfosporosinus metallidurans]OLN30108.1 hypothetical protein DSOL_3240 [Desulfosporosinus metallidurans]
MAEYIYFTDEQKRRANSVDLVDFLQRQGEQLIRSGRDRRLKSDHSITIRGNQWFDHGTEQGGLAIDFVQEFYGLSFPGAVTMLLGGEQGVEFKQTDKSAPAPERKPFALPEANSDMRRVFAYLIKQRFLDRAVLTHFSRAKMLYEDKEYHNAVFVGFDENGVVKHAHKRGTYSNGGGYRGNVESSDPRYSFHYIGTNDRLYVFEAPIDLLSFITLYPKNWQQNSYVALDGVAEHAVLYQLSRNKRLQSVALCLDHDEAGIEATDRLTEIIHEHGYMEVSCLQPEYKDWNECLKARNGVTPIPSQEHPKLEVLPEVCGSLHETCEVLRSARNPYDALLEHYEKLKPLISDGKLVRGKETAVTEHLQCMAAYSLLSVQREYRQLEQPVTTEQLIGELQESYKPHQDRGKLRSKADDIQQDVAAANRQLNTAGIRSLDDKQDLISSCMHLALNCVRTHIFVTLEAQKQSVCKTVREQMDCEQSAQPVLTM